MTQPKEFYVEPGKVVDFIERWRKSGAAELSNAQSFVNELCDLLDVPRPDPAHPDDTSNTYIFEKSIRGKTADGSVSTKRMDCYKQGCFILESKQGSDLEDGEKPLSEKMRRRRERRKVGTAKRGTPAYFEAMKAAKNQAAAYARALPPIERPPFVLVLDIGYSIEVFSDFTGSGEYVAYPDQNRYRITIDDLSRHENIDRLRCIWLNPDSLDESKIRARVSREIADKLARLARTFEKTGEDPAVVANFLMRLIFTMFAEDVSLLPNDCFTDLLIRMRSTPEHFEAQMTDLWQKMQSGGFSAALNVKVKHFNGGLFEDVDTLPVNEDQLELLIEACEADWQEVEPAIFGTLLERALDPRERHKLGAHFTPRAYVERLVMPTVIEPLRADWQDAADTARYHHEEGDEKAAVEVLRKFHDHLCDTKVLDPACGSGNFLYVTLEHMKRIEGEVLEMLESYGYGQRQLHTVDPHQFLGLEINPRARAIADLVLWIGFFQWQFRSQDKPQFKEPIIKKFDNIVEQDAVLAYDGKVPRLDTDGNPVTRWDGRTTKTHPVTGEMVPDETAQEPVYDFVNPRPATWHESDYIVGNPPFVGNKRMREALGDGYVEALRNVYNKDLKSADYVMFWWNIAAGLLKAGRIKHFGFISTNSITQVFNRRIVERNLKDISLIFAIPDHPWVDASDGAAVRIAMSVCTLGKYEGLLYTSKLEMIESDEVKNMTFSILQGIIYSDFTVGTNFDGISNLLGNERLSGQGVIVLGNGFLLDNTDYGALINTEPDACNVIKDYMNGRDLLYTSRGLKIIDLFGLEEKDVKKYPNIYQRIYTTVRPHRLQMKDKARREKWWLFGRSNKEIREAIKYLTRYIATCRTAKHRVFLFLESDILPDAKIIAIALDDAYYLGVLSSGIHVKWSLRTGAWLGVGNDSNYNHSDCFGKFPFPTASEEQKAQIRELGERLDAFRKERQAQHPDLTLTGMYNVLEKLRSGEVLTSKEKIIHEQGLVTVLKEIHDDLDAAVTEAYGWPVDLPEEEILQRLVALNKERAEEEKQGIVRWLRPEYQAPDEVKKAHQKELTGIPAQAEPAAAKGEKQAWPGNLTDQIAAVRNIIHTSDTPLSAEDVAKSFKRARREKVEDILDFLAFDSSIHRTDDGCFSS